MGPTKIDSLGPLNDVPASTRISAVLYSSVLLEVPDRIAREVIETDLLVAITEVLSMLAKGYVMVSTTVRKPMPESERDWLATAAAQLNPPS